MKRYKQVETEYCTCNGCIFHLNLSHNWCIDDKNRGEKCRVSPPFAIWVANDIKLNKLIKIL